MRDALIAILLCGAAVAACEVKDVPKAEPAVVEAEWDDSSDGAGSDVNIRADIQTGKVELKLPGGLEGTVRLPKGAGNDAKFDLDGVGHYPGARLMNVDVRSDNSNGETARVVLGFTAPGSADSVADWYEQALVKKSRSALRSANRISGTTEDGDPMVIAITDGPDGVARGRITITDRKG
jgi:hypothetical protein